MKKKPEKKEQVKESHIYNCPECGDEGYVIGYNQALDDYEAYLPNEEEITEIIYSLKNDRGQLPPDNRIAKVIYKRINQ